MQKNTLKLLAVLYFGSGFAGLVDEVVFFKYLSLAFGATAHASSAVLVSFMGGLALGSYLASRFMARIERPLVAYGVLEVLAGMLCLAVPFLFGLVTRIYVGLVPAIQSGTLLYATRALLAALVILIPATAMGATLPIVSQLVSRDPNSRERLALLYGLNIAGGATGSLVAAYVLIPALGLSGTIRVGAALGVLIGVVALYAGRVAPALMAERTSLGQEDKGSRIAPEISLAAFSSGLLVFSTEVVFVHLLAVIVGTSVYAFGLVITIFLVCLSLGAAFSRPLEKRLGARALPTSLAASALAIACIIPVWDRLPNLFVWFGPHVTSWEGRESIRALVAFSALAVPVMAMGLTFPIVLQGVAGRRDAGRVVGRLTAQNTLGSIAGSLLSGFVLLPLLGSERSLFSIALLYALLSAGVAYRTAVANRGWLYATSGLVLALAAFAPKWDPSLLANGANVYFERHTHADAKTVYFYEDVHSGLTTVTKSGDTVTLYTNGKFEGDNGFQMRAQHAIAHLPSMFAKRLERSIVIGCGTGNTLGILAAYPFETVELAELSPGIIRAAERYFGEINYNVFSSNKLVTRLEDGRNWLLVTKNQYDVISIEISSIWFAGAANLYSREFYELAKRRLTAGGVLQQWVQLHHTRPREIASQLAAVRETFPHVLFFVHGHQGIVLASETPLVASQSRMRSLESRPELRAILLPGQKLSGYLDDVVMNTGGVDRYVADVAKGLNVSVHALIPTDDNAYLEYATPKNNVPGRLDIESMARSLDPYRPSEAERRALWAE